MSIFELYIFPSLICQFFSSFKKYLFIIYLFYFGLFEVLVAACGINHDNIQPLCFFMRASV